MQLEWERAEEARKVAAEQAARQEEERLIRMREQQLRQQEVRVDLNLLELISNLFLTLWE